MMIAHSFKGKIFGPAQRLHGATYIVDVEFRRATLDTDGLVVDIGRATETLREILTKLNYQNHDEVQTFENKNTTTEFLARVVFDAMVEAIHRGELGPHAGDLEELKVTLHESHIASASFTGRISDA